MSNSALVRLGLKHLSASSVIRSVKDTPGFIKEKVFGMYDGVGPSAFRGTAAEFGVAMGIQDHSLSVEHCQNAALDEFDRLAMLNTHPNVEKERALVAGIVERGLMELRPYGVPSHVQQKIEWQHPDLPLPFIGFLDFRFAEHNIIVDLKSKAQLPSKIEHSHAVQVSLYCAAIGQQEGRVTYCTPKKSATYLVENQEAHLRWLVRVVQKLDFLLSRFDKEELKEAFTPDTEQFYYSSDSSKQAANELFRLY